MLASVVYRALRGLQGYLCPLPAGSSKLQTPQIKFPLLIYSHRGGGLDCGLVENTLEAFTYSARLGVDVLELDVQLTKDRTVVVFHDRDLGRLAGPAFRGVTIASCNYDQLPPIQRHSSAAQQASSDSISPHPAGAAKDILKQGRIPMFEEVLRAFPDIPIQVDVKVDTPGLVKAVHDLICKYPDRRQRVLWGSFIHKVQKQLYETDPGIPLFNSMWRTFLLLAAHKCGRMHEVPMYESAMIVPRRVPTPGFLRKLGGPAFWYPFTDKSWTKSLSSRGVSVIVFGQDVITTQAYQYCLDVGAVGICTDTPARLKEYLTTQEGQAALQRLSLTSSVSKVHADDVAGNEKKGLD